MAEERLIDDDKDRKYKIRKNADGEDELYIDDSAEEDEEVIIPVFEVPEEEEDDEDAAAMTPEEYAERERLRREENEARMQKANALISSAEQKLQSSEFEAATYDASRAEEYVKSGEVYCLKLKALSHNFTDFTEVQGCAEAAEGVNEYADDGQRAQLKELAGGLVERIDKLSAEVEELSSENEQGKAERRLVFGAARKRALVYLLCAGLPFAVLAVLTIVFACNMFAAENGAFLIATIVCGAFAAIALVFTLVLLRKFITANRRFNYNESNLSTKLGREYAGKQKELELLNKIYSAIKQ